MNCMSVYSQCSSWDFTNPTQFRVPLLKRQAGRSPLTGWKLRYRHKNSEVRCSVHVLSLESSFASSASYRKPSQASYSMELFLSPRATLIATLEPYIHPSLLCEVRNSRRSLRLLHDSCLLQVATCFLMGHGHSTTCAGPWDVENLSVLKDRCRNYQMETRMSVGI
jgi:hypothetical protein